MHAVAQIGMPEARIILAQAVVHNAIAPKSNAAYVGINEAIADVRAGRGGPVPAHLRGSGYAGAARLGHGKGYVYAHDEPDAVAAQQYLPDDLAGTTDYYRPSDRGFEARPQERWTWLKGRLGRDDTVRGGRSRPWNGRSEELPRSSPRWRSRTSWFGWPRCWGVRARSSTRPRRACARRARTCSPPSRASPTR